MKKISKSAYEDELARLQIELVKLDRVAWIKFEVDWSHTHSFQKTRSYAARPRAVMRLSAFEAICASAI